MQPLISFIIPAFNVPEPMLRECIESILAIGMDAADREIIIVDDGSTTPVDLSLTPHPSSLTLIRQSNQGLSGARNTGIEAAKGEFLQFVDADDALIPEAYNSVVRLARSSRADVFLFDMTTTKGGGEVGSDPQMWNSVDDWAHHNNIKAAAWGYLFRRTLLNDNLRFTPRILHEDEEFTPLLLMRAQSICDTGKCAYFYRQREGSITKNTDEEHLTRRMADFLKVILHLREVGRKTDSYMLRRRVCQLTMDYAYNVSRLIKSGALRKEHMNQAREHDLWPLPVRLYTWKYFVFSLLSHVL